MSEVQFCYTITTSNKDELIISKNTTSKIKTLTHLNQCFADPFGENEQLAVAWRRVVRTLGLWDSVREFARMYDAGMGMIIFAPIAMLSWFPFVSTFQSRLLFNQAFSRGLEISIILAGNKANVQP